MGTSSSSNVTFVWIVLQIKVVSPPLPRVAAPSSWHAQSGLWHGRAGRRQQGQRKAISRVAAYMSGLCCPPRSAWYFACVRL